MTDLEPQHYLLFWQLRSVLDHEDIGAPLDVVASNQLFGVNGGDFIWIVTLGDDRELLLAGRLVVGEVVEHEEAVRRLPGAGLWQAEYYALPAPGTEEPIDLLDVSDFAEELRFDDSPEGEDRLHPVDGRVNPQQLRSIRRLTPESAEMLMDFWLGDDGGEFETFDDDEVDPQELLQHCRREAEAHPEDPEVHYNLGVALGMNGMEEEALRAYERAAELEPLYLKPHYNRGQTLLALGRPAEAVEAFNAAVLAGYDFAPAHFMLGVAHAEDGDLRAAIAATERGLEIDPEDPSAHFNIGKFRFDLGEYREAMEALAVAERLDPEFARAIFWSGKCHRMLGERAAEIDAYKRALDVTQHIDAMFALGAAYTLERLGPTEPVRYIETGGEFEFGDPLQSYYFAAATLALGIDVGVDDQEAKLRDTAPELANRLRRLVEAH